MSSSGSPREADLENGLAFWWEELGPRAPLDIASDGWLEWSRRRAPCAAADDPAVAPFWTSWSDPLRYDEA